MRRYPLLALAALSLVTTQAIAGEQPGLRIKLTPVKTQGQLSGIQVEETFKTAGQALAPLSLASRLGPLAEIDSRIHDIKLVDAKGAIALKDGTAPSTIIPGGSNHTWTPGRQSQGPVTLSYIADVSHLTIPGPTWELRSEARGISGSGITFLILPEDKRQYQVKLSWDLSAIGKDASTLDSLPQNGQGSLDRILQSYFMAGHLLQKSAGPFKIASTAKTHNFSQQSLLDWIEKAYFKLSALYGNNAPPPFTVALRTNTLTTISGTALPQSLMSIMSPDVSKSDIESLMAHEMTHVFLYGTDPQSWFQEGLAMTYQDRAPFATGLIGMSQYINGVNQVLRSYYSNVRKHISMQEGEKAFWTDARARLVPYDRGALYFMVTDGRLRAKSANKNNLDKVLRQFMDNYRAGKPALAKDWLALLGQYLDKSTVEKDYQTMLTGQGTLVPPEQSFGPCFTRVKQQMPLFELGFDISSLMHNPKIIKGLNPDSAAAKAGLRNGDVVTNPIGLDESQAHPSHTMTLVVNRAGKTLNIRFKPEGKLTEGYQWQARKGAKGDQCRL
ncbi:M61 metallopeptidase family protein [Gallaecimonas mangrovi]|uniref:hypothetical protein n=1 Tax=Gallaecimonas mangrovi TaxID=2291597 RepID=UPI000E202134|nr:hypothetical protein [Gallaecimonas mangrovi]